MRQRSGSRAIEESLRDARVAHDDGQGFRLGRAQSPAKFTKLLTDAKRPRLRLVELSA